MKARSREINVFSLSLMDVISGAMGAFLIIMVLLAQFYEFDPATSEKVDDLREPLDAAIAGLSDIRSGVASIFDDLIESQRGAESADAVASREAAGIEALSRAVASDIERVTNHLAAVHEKTNLLERELQEKTAQLQRGEERLGRLEIREPIVVAAYWDCNANVDLFLQSDRVSALDDTPGVEFDPRLRQQQSFTGDISSNTQEGPAAEMSMVSETPPSTSYKIFVNLMAGPSDVRCAVVTHAMGSTGFFAVPPAATLTFANPYDYLGAITVSADREMAYKEPGAAEREKELALVRKRIAAGPAPKKETTP
jgi:hypothetical protein